MIAGAAYTLILAPATPVWGQEPGVEIISPADGSIVSPCQVLQMEVQPVGGFVVKAILLASPFDGRTFSAPPFVVDVSVPIEAAGSFNLVALARGTSGHLASDTISLIVQQVADLELLSVTPSRYHFARFGSTSLIFVTGTYSDGVGREIADAALGTSYASNDTSVVTVSPDGIMTAQGPGAAVVTVSNSDVSAQVEVTVGFDPGFDFCGDGLINDTPVEECDDGNNNDGDGCDANCRIELSKP